MRFFTYLLGAGASVKALPLVSTIPKTLEQTISELQHNNMKLTPHKVFDNSPLKKSIYEYQQDLIYALRYIKNGAENHASIDTFAKKLFITNNFEDLNRLKAALVCFFIYLQQKHPADPRYDAFIASIIEKTTRSFQIPDNLKLLTWNYDYQFEKAFGEYALSSQLSNVRSKLNARPQSFVSESFPNNKFGIFKLNGTTGIHKVENESISVGIDDMSSKVDLQLLEKVVKMYGNMTEQSALFKPLITFAWEDNVVANKVVSDAISTTSNTNVLVVIGYSFPFFNRLIDRVIIGRMKNLQKVYIQAPIEFANGILGRFRAIRTDYEKLSPEIITDTDQFYLPPEL